MTRAPKRRNGPSWGTLDRHMALLTDFDRSLLALSQKSTKVLL